MKKDALYEQLSEAIAEGGYPAGSCLPKELELAAQFNVSRNTVRSALKRLELETRIVRLKGRGTFVAERAAGPKPGILVLADFSADKRYPFHYIVPAINREAERLGYRVENCDMTQFSIFSPEQARRLIRDNGIERIIVIGSSFLGDEPLVCLMRRLNLPVVLAHGYAEDHATTGWGVVEFDARAAWRAAFEYLARLGHRRVAVTAYRFGDDTIRRWPRDAYFKMLKSLHLDPSPELLLETDLATPEGFLPQLDQLLQDGAMRPSAVLCWSDFVAPGIYAIVKKNGLRIPRDLSVMGFCGGMNGKFFDPSLSTVDLQYEECGRLAVEMAHAAGEWFEPGMPGPVLTAPFQIIGNGSTDSVGK